MKRGLSTGKPTKREAERIVACKEGCCVACIQNESVGYSCDYFGCDYHHLLSGGRRRGHRFGVALCAWHHRAVPHENRSHEEMRFLCGPSLMDGSRIFRETYGTDDELLAIQDELIGWADE